MVLMFRLPSPTGAPAVSVTASAKKSSVNSSTKNDAATKNSASPPPTSTTAKARRSSTQTSKVPVVTPGHRAGSTSKSSSKSPHVAYPALTSKGNRLFTTPIRLSTGPKLTSTTVKRKNKKKKEPQVIRLPTHSKTLSLSNDNMQSSSYPSSTKLTPNRAAAADAGGVHFDQKDSLEKQLQLQHQHFQQNHHQDEQEELTLVGVEDDDYQILESIQNMGSMNSVEDLVNGIENEEEGRSAAHDPATAPASRYMEVLASENGVMGNSSAKEDTAHQNCNIKSNAVFLPTTTTTMLSSPVNDTDIIKQGQYDHNPAENSTVVSSPSGHSGENSNASNLHSPEPYFLDDALEPNSVTRNPSFTVTPASYYPSPDHLDWEYSNMEHFFDEDFKGADGSFDSTMCNLMDCENQNSPSKRKHNDANARRGSVASLSNRCATSTRESYGEEQQARVENLERDNDSRKRSKFSPCGYNHFEAPLTSFGMSHTSGESNEPLSRHLPPNAHPAFLKQLGTTQSAKQSHPSSSAAAKTSGSSSAIDLEIKASRTIVLAPRNRLQGPLSVRRTPIPPPPKLSDDEDASNSLSTPKPSERKHNQTTSVLPSPSNFSMHLSPANSFSVLLRSKGSDSVCQSFTSLNDSAEGKIRNASRPFPLIPEGDEKQSKNHGVGTLFKEIPNEDNAAHVKDDLMQKLSTTQPPKLKLPPRLFPRSKEGRQLLVLHGSSKHFSGSKVDHRIEDKSSNTSEIKGVLGSEEANTVAITMPDSSVSTSMSNQFSFYSFMREILPAFECATFLLPGLKNGPGKSDFNAMGCSIKVSSFGHIKLGSGLAGSKKSGATNAEVSIAKRRVESAICAFGGSVARKSTSKPEKSSIFRSKPTSSHSTKSKSKIHNPRWKRYEDKLRQQYFEHGNRLSWEVESNLSLTLNGNTTFDEEDSTPKRATITGTISQTSSMDQYEATAGSPSRPKKYKCKLCGQLKQNHVCPYEESILRSIGVMIYPAVNAHVAHEPGSLAPPLTEMNNFALVNMTTSSTENTQTSDITPETLTAAFERKGIAMEPKAADTTAMSPYRRKTLIVPTSSTEGEHVCPKTDLIFRTTMDISPQQYRTVTPCKEIKPAGRAAYSYPHVPLTHSQRKSMSDALFAISKKVPALTRECAIVLKEAREKDMWDLAVAELMAQVVCVAYCSDSEDYKLEGLQRYLLTLGISC